MHCIKHNNVMFLDFIFHRHREMLPMPYKRELHCHIVPGVDDGSESLEESLQLIKGLSEMGIESIIFTPHHTEPRFLNTPEVIEPLFQTLRSEVQQAGIPVQLEDYSFEYRIDESFIQMMSTGKWGESQCMLRPLKGRYLLIENSFGQPLYNLPDVLSELQQKGWFLIMAHPERYRYYQQRGLSSYEHLAELGVEFQCNVLSFSGYYGEHAQKTARRLLDEGMISFLGSDMHNKHHVDLLKEFLSSKDYARLRDDLVLSSNNDKI